MENQAISIRKALPDDADDFTNLILTAGKLLPAIYGKKTASLLYFLFHQPNNIYSYENTLIAEYEGQVSGAVLGYTFENSQMQQKRTRGLIISFLRLKFIFIIGKLKKVHQYLEEEDKDSYYISHIATYSQFRKKGIGKALINDSVKEARNAGKRKLVLDVLTENVKAIDFYEEFGFRREKTHGILFIKNQKFEYVKMVYYIAD